MSPPRVVIVGAGLAGYHAASALSRRMRGGAEVVLVNPTGFTLYLPLLLDVAAGKLDPSRVTVPLARALPGVRVVLGTVDRIDTGSRRVHYVDADQATGLLAYDRLIVTVGGVTKVRPVSAVSAHSFGFHDIAEALHLRDHIERQLYLAATSDNPTERAARRTFVVLGAGHTGTEVAAAGQLMSRQIARRHPWLREQPIRWILAEPAERLLPDMHPRLSETATRVLRRRGVDVRTRTSVGQVTSGGLRLSDGEFVPTRTIVWSFGVRPDPLINGLRLAVEQGRIRVDEYLSVPGHPEIYVCGDAAAVPDLTRPGKITPMSGRHAVRQGRLAGRNVAASLGSGRREPYRHGNRGATVDLGGWQAAADPLGIPFSGIAAKAATRACRLFTVPANRMAIVNDWLADALLPGRRTPRHRAPVPMTPLNLTQEKR
ncbi:NAD(P)/FAD-dependent oxidoreductase [Nonomuraea dietziae]|uniref:NADH dehydrogenase n=1 Tax=Nonomuraea dietziae TaxID=65515 RepID=A0A7W5V9V9_9ACTN|nr:FAD-dependent oxidoreductase [Nonomuraea dietziae]MBB3727600.1 NADH dehydrogenase [Nonomuraea dietziae]